MLEKHLSKAPSPAPVVEIDTAAHAVQNTGTGRLNRGIAARKKDNALIQDIFGTHLANKQAWEDD